MRLAYLLFAISTSIIAVKAAGYGGETEAWLARLDSVIMDVDQYEQDRRDYVQGLITQRDMLRTDRDIYSANCKLYDECSTFDSDMALDIAIANEEIARRRGDKDGISEWQINHSFLLSVTGMLMEANAIIEQVDTHDMPRYLKVKYFGQKIYLYTHFGQYIGTNGDGDHYSSDVKALRDSLDAVMHSGDRDYAWYKASKYISENKTDSARIVLSGRTSNASLTTKEEASNAYAMAQLYKAEGDNERYIQYLAMSSIADLRTANKDIASLEELAGVIYDQQIKGQSGDSDQHINRAYSYISVCMMATQKFHNRVRVISISRVLDNIYKAFMERDRQHRIELQRNLWMAVGLLILLIVAITVVVLTLRNIRKVNGKLAVVVEDLKNKNVELEESNYVKEEYIGYVFSLCSSYISKIDEYRKSINRKMKVNQHDEVMAMTDKSVVQDEMQRFYKDFDAIFLHIYPNFVSDFNNLLQPDERIEPKKGELLNTDLRIYALVRLGINDSVKIAELLHCSPQTVYNNRVKIRNKAIVPKEQFIEAVQALGRAEK